MQVNNIAVTGSNGFVGRALCNKLVQTNSQVVAVSRSAADMPSGVASVVIQDINDSTDWSSTLIGCNTVIHLAARVHVMNELERNALNEFRRVNVVGTANLARSAVKAGVKRMVYVSSVKVNGESTSLLAKFNEQSSPAPLDDYGVSKYEAELELLNISKETGLEIVIVRPPLIYGPAVKGNFLRMLSLIQKGFPLPLGSIKNQRDLLYVENLVDALILCATHPKAAGKIYLVSDGQPISTPDLFKLTAQALGKKITIFSFPVWLLTFVAGILDKRSVVDRLTQSLQVDNSKIRNELGWAPVYTLEQGLQATAEWYSAKGYKAR